MVDFSDGVFLLHTSLDVEEDEALGTEIRILGFDLNSLRQTLRLFLVSIRHKKTGEEKDEVDCNCIEEGEIKEIITISTKGISS